MAMVEAEDRFAGTGPPEDPEGRRRAAEQRCLEAEQRCFQAERRRFEAERRREQVEALLAEARRAGIKMEQIVGELKRLVATLREAAERPGPGAGATPSPPEGDGDMVDALTAAIARLRANVEAVGDSSAQGAARARSAAEPPAAAEPTPGPTQAAPHAVWPQTLVPPAIPPRPLHKHSMSWIARWRARRKQRR